MAKKKFYAIRLGMDPIRKVPVSNIILDSWDEAKEYVFGIKKISVDYKGFKYKDDAEAYLKKEDPLLRKKDGLYPVENSLHCYVDGSYNADIPNYSYGLVCVVNGDAIHQDFGPGNNKEAVNMQQVAGELLGAMKALLYAKNNGFKEVVIFHDYKGVCYHALGYWERDNQFSETYFNWMQSFFASESDLQIHFCKVDAHSGDEFNELADGLAKKGAGIEPNPIFYKLESKHFACS